jgi:hypothetical protein
LFSQLEEWSFAREFTRHAVELSRFVMEARPDARSRLDLAQALAAATLCAIDAHEATEALELAHDGLEQTGHLYNQRAPETATKTQIEARILSWMLLGRAEELNENQDGKKQAVRSAYELTQFLDRRPDGPSQLSAWVAQAVRETENREPEA